MVAAKQAGAPYKAAENHAAARPEANRTAPHAANGPLARSLLLMRNLLRVPRPHPGLKLACRVRRVRSLPLMRNLLRVPRLHPGLNLACRVRRVPSLLLMRNLLRVPSRTPV